MTVAANPATGPYGGQYDATEGIAIVGMAGRFPGASDVQALWQNILAGVDSVSRFPRSALEPSFREDMLAREQPGYVCARGILDDVDRFDEAFFGFTPAEAALLDPQQRLFLQAAWEALEHAGHDPEAFAGLIGIFAGGTANSYYLNHLQSRPDVTDKLGLLTTQMANQGHYIATRAAYKLNLRGPALNIHTACSTSLVAVCTAVQSLQSFQCDMALAGGVSVSLPQQRGYLHQEGSILSPDGVCRAFDANAAGTVFGNGLGVVVLRRLADALEDGNTIYAVIKGAALNNDGHDKLSFTAPSIQGQAEVISMAQAAAGIDPQTISYVEAHGTGTQLGDPIEVAALTQAFRAGGDRRKGACALGSIKTQLGHLDAAAGVTGLIRTALALHHRTLPASLHFETPNPKLDLENSPFFVNDQVRPWPEGPSLRRAGVSSFGVGGTNAHVVLEEASGQTDLGVRKTQRAAQNTQGTQGKPGTQLLVVSARDEAALERASLRLRAHIESLPEASSAEVAALDWANLAYTLHSGRRAFGWRRAWACRDKAEALSQMARPMPNPGAAIETLRVAFLFPGQGSQQVNAGRGLYAAEPVFRTELDACAELLLAPLGVDIRSLMFPAPGNEVYAAEQLAQTAFTQPVLLALQLALARLWMSWGVQPAVLLGHSVGEFAAACLAGTFSREDALRLVAERGRLMQHLQPGAMLAVRAAPDELRALLGDASGVDVAAINGPKATVLAGPADAVARVQARLNARDVGHRLLPSERAFHSAMMDPILADFERCVQGYTRHAPKRPWVSSMTGQLVTTDDACSVRYWVQQMRAPVQFSQALACCATQVDALLEVGAGDTLTKLALQQPATRGLRIKAVSLPPRACDDVADANTSERSDADIERAGMLAAAGQLWSAGAGLEWSRLQPGPHQRVALPTYPFARNRHWVDPAPAPAPAQATAQAAARPGQCGSAPQAELESALAERSPAPVVASGRPAVLARLQALFADLAGVEAHTLEPTANLLEWGLDSLILTQASQALQKQFGVRVPMRALLEDLPTLDALADHLLPQMPRTPHPQNPAVDSLMSDVSSPNWLASFEQQLAQMSQQLQVLRSGQISQVPADTGPVAQVQVGAPAAPTAPLTAPPTGFGPFRPPSRGTSALSPQQQARLLDFIARYNRHTQGSKAQTQNNRAHLADPRSVAGFRQLWKELVYPLVTVRSEGAHLWDVDGNRYIDITNGFGMILFGHNPPFIREALQDQLAAGYEIGPQTPLAGEVAAALCQMVGLERAAFCATGSEAVMAAIRVARTVTGRDRIVIFNGAYHGIFDEVLVRPGRTAGQAFPGRSVPIAPGIPQAMADNVVVLDYGSPESLRAIEAMGSTVAAVLVEPVQSRRPELQPQAFLHELRALTAAAGSALIFDEVVTGFRVHPGGAQAHFGVRADLATYGKVLGGGLPIGVVAGAARFMDALDGGAWAYGDISAPEVGVTFFAGTFVRHPLALAAARAVLARLREAGPELQNALAARTAHVVGALQAEIDILGLPLKVAHFSSWFHFQWAADVPLAALFFAAMRMRGIHVWEGRPCFITTAHTDSDLQAIVTAARESLEELQQAGLLPAMEPRSEPAPAWPLAAEAAATPAAEAVAAAPVAIQPPVAGARKGRDNQGREAWFIPDPQRPGKYLQVLGLAAPS